MEELLKASQVAEILGKPWTRMRVHTYLARESFPHPAAMAGNSPLWTREQIEDYASKKGIIIDK